MRLLQPYRLASAEAERGSMSTKVNPAAIMATLIPEGSEYLSPLQHGYWAIPVSPSLPDQVKVHPAVSSIAWSHFNPSLPHSSSSPRTLEWSYKRLKTFWHRMSAASKNFGGIVLDCHFLDDREEMRLYCSGRRALLWRKLLDTLKLDGAGKEDSERWFKGVGLVWRAQNGKAVLVA